MRTWIDFDDAPVFEIPLTDAIDGRRVHQGMLIEGPQGWGEFSAPPDVDDERAGRWLTASVEAGTVGWPDPVRGRVPVAVTVPAVNPDRAREIVAAAGCRTASIRVGDPGGTLAADIARVAAVRAALGPSGLIRCDANGNWDVDTAVAAIAALDQAAGGLEFIEQPCRTLAEVSAVRRRVGVQVAVDQSIRQAPDPLRLQVASSADIAVLTVAALGGVRRALRVAESCALPCVVSGSLESSIGTAGGLALAGVLPDTGYASVLGVGMLGGDIVSAGRALIPVDGTLPVSPMPPAPDPARLTQFAADEATVARWRHRLASVRRYM